MTAPFGTGAIPSPVDYRDGIAAAIAGQAPVLPPSFDTDMAALGVMNQQKTPACVSHAWALIMKLYWYQKTGKIVDFSPRFLHILSNDFNAGPEDGRYPRTVARISVKLGCCTTATMPNDTNLDNAAYQSRGAITQAMLDEAAQYRLPGYVRIPDLSSSDFRNGVFLYGAISGLFQIGSEWWIPSWSPKDIDPLRTPAKVVSGHEVVVKGWQSNLNTLRNSWGAQWGTNGETHYDAQAWLPFVLEGWAVADIPKEAQAFLSSLPKATDFHYQWSNDLAAGQTSNAGDISMAQLALIILGYLKPILPEEFGHYGPKTAIAVGKYQAAKGIAPSAPNSIGPRTRAALNAQFAL